MLTLDVHEMLAWHMEERERERVCELVSSSMSNGLGWKFSGKWCEVMMELEVY